MSTNKKAEKIVAFPVSESTQAESQNADLVTFAQGDLGKIQNILFGDPSKQIEKRLQVIEADYRSRLEKMEQIFTRKLDQLTQADAEKVSQAKLAKILSALATEVPDK